MRDFHSLHMQNCTHIVHASQNSISVWCTNRFRFFSVYTTIIFSWYYSFFKAHVFCFSFFLPSKKAYLFSVLSKMKWSGYKNIFFFSVNYTLINYFRSWSAATFNVLCFAIFRQSTTFCLAKPFFNSFHSFMDRKTH